MVQNCLQKMRFLEKQGSLLENATRESTILNPISADYSLTGLAEILDRLIPYHRVLEIKGDRSLCPDCIYANGVLNLVYKRTVESQTDIETVKKALEIAKAVIAYEEIPLVAMQPFACGPNGPRWWEIKDLIKNTWASLPVKVEVYNYERR